MLKYLNVIGYGHAAVGGLGSLFALPLLASSVLFFAYWLFSFVEGIFTRMTGINYLWYGLEELVEIGILCSLVGLPAAMLLALGVLQLWAGIGVVRRKPRARVAAMAASVPAILGGLPGIALAVGTFVVMNDDQVKAAFRTA